MYRVEIFDSRATAFVSAFQLDKRTTIYYDYLNPRKFDIDGPADLTCEVRHTLRIADGTDYIFSGYIDNIDRGDTKTTLTVAPLVMLLNEMSIQNVGYTDWARQISLQLWYDFQQPTPSLYPLPLYRYSGSSYQYQSWDGVQRPYGAELKNDMECILLARRTYGKFLVWGIGSTQSSLGQAYYGFVKRTGWAIFDADFENVISKEITESSQNNKNMLIIWMPSQNDPNNYVHYTACLINGEIVVGDSRKYELTEWRMATKVLNEYTAMTTDEIKNMAVQYLKPAQDNLDIKLTYRRGDLIGRPEARNIGQPSRIYYQGKTYETYQTGVIYNKDTITLVFGMTRQGLTEQLNEEGV